MSGVDALLGLVERLVDDPRPLDDLRMILRREIRRECGEAPSSSRIASLRTARS